MLLTWRPCGAKNEIKKNREISGDREIAVYQEKKREERKFRCPNSPPFNRKCKSEIVKQDN